MQQTVIKNKDFVQIEYTGIIKDDGIIFDTTNEEIAKREGIYNETMPYGQYVICVGEGQILNALDNELIGKELNKEYSVEFTPENAFGKKDAKLLKLVPANVFKKQGIDIHPGLQVSIDGTIGTIRTVTGGRTIVDFNHPLSGKNIVYQFKINKIIADDKEKIHAYLKMALGTNDKNDFSASLNNGALDIKLRQEYPQEYIDKMKSSVMELIPSIKTVGIGAMPNKESSNS